MIITCPQCQARYRINPSAGSKPQARVKCPSCQHTFVVTIEAVPVTPEPVPAPAPAPVTATVQPLVLVVDDARFFREVICDMLTELPIRVETAGDGEDALRKIQSLRPSLVLLDLNIPGLSGQELISAVRRDPTCHSVRILAMSGVQRGEEAAQIVRGLGADDFINKSFKPRDLQNLVRQMLRL
jgi:predicted Zn finger-like uncharacterized protein